MNMTLHFWISDCMTMHEAKVLPIKALSAKLDPTSFSTSMPMPTLQIMPEKWWSLTTSSA